MRVGLSESDCGKIFITELTVIVPTDAKHAFWTSTDSTDYSWDHENDHGTEFYECVMTKYGGSKVDAEWRATTSAIELIRCARNNYHVRTPLPTSYTSDCSVLKLGRKIYEEFQTKKQNFGSKGYMFWRQLNTRIDEMISTESRKNILLLLKYYKVHSISLAFCISKYVLPRNSLARCREWACSKKQSNYSKRWSDVYLWTCQGNIIEQCSWVSFMTSGLIVRGC